MKYQGDRNMDVSFSLNKSYKWGIKKKKWEIGDIGHNYSYFRVNNILFSIKCKYDTKNTELFFFAIIQKYF